MKFRPTPLEDWPTDPDKVRVIFSGPAREHNRRTFSLLWWQDGKRRGQCGNGVFKSKPGDGDLYTWDEVQAARNPKCPGCGRLEHECDCARTRR